ncbi:Cytochrome P450 4C1 [Trachymyrmex septentrionalis]|uniref:Cytochrome P450 4C1 n=1 Tax=Trachymyrmex septentrionalis TaxID=34720 RepID=A0A195EZK5_9HYME|nr:Cytochrome P450 4C1 [Trachymyrmex septentrionalis]
MIVITLTLFVLIILMYNYYVHYGRNGRLINLIPGPSGYPIIGHVLLLQGSREILWKLLNKMTDKYYPICKIWGFFTPIVSIRDPDDMEAILNNMKHINKSIIYDVLLPWFNTGLLTSGGAKWHSRRKILTPAFHFNILQHFVEVLIEESENMTKSLQNTGGTVVKDLIPFISERTLNAICETAMGTSLRDQDAYEQRYRKAVHQMGEIIMYRLMRQWLRYNGIFSLMPKGKQQAKTLRILHGFTERIEMAPFVYKSITYKHFCRTIIVGNYYVVRKKRLALLDLLIAASRKGLLTDLDIREEVDTFMFEGHDTVAKAICFALLLLAEHKDIQNRVRDEICTAIEENGKKFTMNILQNLSYLDRCIKETLRLYPSVYFISRITSEDLKLNSYIIPAKTIVHLNIYGLHRDPKFWPNPEIFDPDRFLFEKIRNRHPYSYLPFSAGPRNCIGQRFALLEMKAMIASLVHNFYLEPIDYLKNLRMEVDLVLHPAHPLQDLWKLQRQLCKEYYPIYKLWCGPIAFVSIHHPDDLEKVLNSAKEHLSKGYLYDSLIPWLGTGLLTSEGTKWHKRRKILTPTFHFNILKQFVEILIDEGNRMAKFLKDTNGSVNDLISLVSHHTMNAICETAMGTSLQEMSEFQQYRQAIHDMGKIIIYRIIKERKQYHERTNGRYLKHVDDMTETDEEIIGIKKKRLAMLDLLIAAVRNGEMNDVDIREEVDTFIFEGHDTVAIGLTYAILLLAEHEDVQKRARNEISAIIEANGGKLTMSALNNMPYLERCLKESLRLYPSVPFISRVLSKDLQTQTHLVPSGTILHVNIYDIHRDPNFWPNPDVFDPDRFLLEKIQKRHPYSYLPFSAGPRNCIEHYAATFNLLFAFMEAAQSATSHRSARKRQTVLKLSNKFSREAEGRVFRMYERPERREVKKREEQWNRKKQRAWRTKRKTRIGERYGLVELRSSCTEITDAACFTLERKCLEEHSTMWATHGKNGRIHISIIGRPHPDPSLDTVPLNQRHRRYIHDPAVSRQASKTWIGRPDPSSLHKLYADCKASANQP